MNGKSDLSQMSVNVKMGQVWHSVMFGDKINFVHTTNVDILISDSRRGAGFVDTINNNSVLVKCLCSS